MRIAIVTPLYRAELSRDEELSLRHLRHFLGHYDLVFAAPASIPAPISGAPVRRFPERYFHSPQTYNRLLLSRGFYKSFADYDYILIYQLDCLVFATGLDAWCAQGWDYIGAPWFPEFADGADGQPLWAVGNGGFSLRRVASCMRVLESKTRMTTPAEYWRRHFAGRHLATKAARLPKLFLKSVGVANSVGWYTKRLTWNEDAFWGLFAKQFDPAFNVASLEAALSFSFEKNPRLCFERNGSRLPFGCHAWAKYDRAFWEPYLLAPVDQSRTGK